MKQLVVNYDPETKFCELFHPYNKRFVAFISQGVKPLSMRRYDQDSRRWSVHLAKIPQVVAAGKRYFDLVDYRTVPPEIQIKIVQFCERGSAQIPSVVDKSKDPYETLFVLPQAPPEVIKAAYRALASLHHPDHGGDPKMFLEIDAAWKKLKS